MVFWAKLNDLCAVIIDEDKNHYAKAMNCEKCDISEISAVEIWKLYTGDLAHGMEEHAKHKLCSTTDYMNLQVRHYLTGSNFSAKINELKMIYKTYWGWCL